MRSISLAARKYAAGVSSKSWRMVAGEQADAEALEAMFM